MCASIRNLNFEDGLFSDRTICISSVLKFLLEVSSPENTSKTFSISRVNFKLSAGKKGLKIMRRQFPVRLAKALTVNKSQGHTLDIVGVDLRDHLFAHCQLYAALSRAREMKNVCLLAKTE